MLNNIVTDTAKQIAEMAQNEGTVDHARFRLRELQRDNSGLFENITELVKIEIERLKNGNS